MMTPLIHCTESDSMSEKEFRASIELLGLIQQKDTNKYHIHFPTDNGYNFFSEPITVGALRIEYKQFQYVLGEYKRLLHILIKDIKFYEN